MDLAAIRKKAKSAQKDEGAATPPKTSTDAPRPVQGTPPHGEMRAEHAAVARAGESPEDDPLAALFAAPLEMELATEESYMQAVSGRLEKDESGLRKFLTFVLDKEEYALDIAFIREIIKPREITDIPRVPGFILGIISLRGIIIPVFDLKQRLKLGKVEISDVSRIIVSQVEDRIVGLLVDNISQVVQLSTRTIEPPPAVLTGIDRELVEGVGRHQDRMMILLQLPSVIDAELI